MAAVYPNRNVSDSLSGDAAPNESSASAAAWPAIFAGAVVAVSASLILIALGSGIGLASVSPWPNSGASVTTFTVMTAVWLIVIQWVSSLLGGYITGRLRTKWVGTHTHEVFFRDTANGLVMWALATVIGALVLASAAANVAGKGVEAASAIASGGAQAAVSSSSLNSSGEAYQVDRLFRPGTPDAPASKGNAHEETVRILAQSAVNGEVSAEDRAYLVSEVAAQTGVSQQEAQKRVDDLVAATKTAELKAKEAADTARKAAVESSIFLALSMLVGAFIASAAAALGGKLRDIHP